MNILTHPLFELCALMFSAGFLTANLPWRWRNRRTKELLRELADLRLRNQRLVHALEDRPTKEDYAEIQGLLGKRRDDLARERLARDAAETALRQSEHQLADLEKRRSESSLAELEGQLDERTAELSRSKNELERLRASFDSQRGLANQYEGQCSELRDQLQAKNAEYAEVLNELDAARTLLEEERSWRESIQADQREGERELVGVRGELADFRARHNEELSHLESALQQEKSAVSRLTEERDSIQTALRKERDARQGLKHLVDERQSALEQLTAELTEVQAERDQQVRELEHRSRGLEEAIARLERENAYCNSQLAEEAASRQSAEQSRRELLGDNQRLARELHKADALLEERLFLARRLKEHESLLGDLRAKHQSLQQGVEHLARKAQSLTKATILNRIWQLQREVAAGESVDSEPLRRSA